VNNILKRRHKAGNEENGIEGKQKKIKGEDNLIDS